MDIDKVFILFSKADDGTENVVNVFRTETYCERFREYYTQKNPSLTFRVQAFDVVDERNATRTPWEPSK